MANIKISELNELTSVASNDVLPIVDTSLNETKKVSVETLIPEIKNTYSESQENAYSCNYVNSLNTYSTDEIKVGTWINGKPIYRKCFEILKSQTSSAATDITHGIQNLEMFVSVRGVLLKQNGTEMNIIPNGFTNDDYAVYTSDNTARIIRLRMGSGAYSVMTKAYIIAEYTKTTD